MFLPIKLFIPSDSLIKTAQSTLQMLAIITSAITIIAMIGAGLYVLTWFCGVLVLFIHALSGVFYAASIASWATQDAGFIFLVTLSLVANAKFACIIFPSLPSFFVQREVRA